jgi:hypothetical protein
VIALGGELESQKSAVGGSILLLMRSVATAMEKEHERS